MLAIKNNAARAFIFSGRADKVTKKITIKPMEKPNAFQSVDPKIWALVKDQPLVKYLINEGQLVIKDSGHLDENDELVDAVIENRPLSGDALVKGKEAVAEEVANALESGDIDDIRDKYPAFSKMLDDMVTNAVEKQIDENADADSESIDTADVENIDSLLEKLGDNVSDDDMKRVLSEYGESKHDLSFHHNTGVVKMIEQIKEVESGD